MRVIKKTISLKGKFLFKISIYSANMATILINQIMYFARSIFDPQLCYKMVLAVKMMKLSGLNIKVLNLIHLVEKYHFHKFNKDLLYTLFHCSRQSIKVTHNIPNIIKWSVVIELSLMQLT